MLEVPIPLASSRRTPARAEWGCTRPETVPHCLRTRRPHAPRHPVEPSAGGLRRSKHLSPRAYFNESADLAVEHVYSEAILNAVEASEDGSMLDSVTLSARYIQAAGDVAKRRAVEAGFRLAALPEPYFGVS